MRLDLGCWLAGPYHLGEPHCSAQLGRFTRSRNVASRPPRYHAPRKRGSIPETVVINREAAADWIAGSNRTTTPVIFLRLFFPGPSPISNDASYSHLKKSITCPFMTLSSPPICKCSTAFPAC